MSSTAPTHSNGEVQERDESVASDGRRARNNITVRTMPTESVRRAAAMVPPVVVDWHPAENVSYLRTDSKATTVRPRRLTSPSPTADYWIRGRSNSEPSSDLIPPLASRGTSAVLITKGQDDRAACSSSPTSRARTRSPEDWRHSSVPLLNCVPEDAEMLVEESHNRSTGQIGRRDSRTSTLNLGYYGTMGVRPWYPASIELSEDVDLSEEEEELILDEELAKSGLYRASYKNLVLLYALVPLSTLFTFVILALLPLFAFHSTVPSTFPYPPYLPFPLPEVFTAAALWSLSYILHDILYQVSSSLTSCILHRLLPSFIPFLTSILAAVLQNTCALILRQLAVPILLVPLYSSQKPRFWEEGASSNEVVYTTPRPNFPTWEDVAFKRVWWIALGWAAAEAVLGVKQGYENIALYKDVLVSVRKSITKPDDDTNHHHVAFSADPLAVGGGGGGGGGGASRGGTVAARTPSRSVDKRPLEVDRPQEFPPRRRDHSSSLSSITSEDHNAASAMLGGERRPLLTTTTFSNHNPTTDVQDHKICLAEEDEVEQDLEELIRLKNREDLEDVFGMPFIQIPIFISCLHRINLILSSLGICLVLTASYMRSTFAYDYSSSSPKTDSFFFPPPAAWTNQSHQVVHKFTPSNRALFCSFLTLLVVQTMLSVMHTPWILPRIGVHTFVYVSLLVWLGVFFGSLGFWEALS